MARPISLPKTAPLTAYLPMTLVMRVIGYAAERGGRRGDAIRELLELGLDSVGATLRAGQSALLAGKGGLVEFRIALDPSKQAHQDALALFEARAAALSERGHERFARLQAERKKH
jgi:hypothetical protein